MCCYLASDFSLAALEQPFIWFPCKTDNWTKGLEADFALQQFYWELYAIYFLGKNLSI